MHVCRLVGKVTRVVRLLVLASCTGRVEPEPAPSPTPADPALGLDLAVSAWQPDAYAEASHRVAYLLDASRTKLAIVRILHPAAVGGGGRDLADPTSGVTMTVETYRSPFESWDSPTLEAIHSDSPLATPIGRAAAVAGHVETTTVPAAANSIATSDLVVRLDHVVIEASDGELEALPDGVWRTADLPPPRGRVTMR